MAGVPVYLASISKRSPLVIGKATSTQLWSDATRAEAEGWLLRLLGPAGNPDRERLFRMQITLCLHRALTADEVAALPEYFHRDPATDLAGGPVEILRETERGSPTTLPCHAPIRRAIDRRDPLLWLPIDCGACPPCRARHALDTEYDKKREGVAQMIDDASASVGPGPR